ncbi:hypothetical protein [Aporhodopirellula aestuarii]|uniref:Uncharacterized protein n=1 Tax=Aporhodopirellula aestuarii TaxID=2950107 RepID=A0ABT0TZV2_9BACT|nr:hypothetical protein [Aporhodopirellula aestuarii]MCM2370100.1 hypothetical protein [Aporhodopirellula aestuarii]
MLRQCFVMWSASGRLLPASVLGVCLVHAALVGCNQSSSTPATPHQPLTLAPAETSPPQNGDPGMVTQDEAIAFADKWAEAIRLGDAAQVRQLLDFQTIFIRSLEGVIDDEEFRAGYLKGADGAADNFVRTTSPYVGRPGGYELVRVVYRDGQAHAVFRLFDDQGRLNYHDLRLVRERDAVLADELFIAATGEAFSDTLRVVVSTAVSSQNSFVGRLSGQAVAEMKRLENQVAISRAIQLGNNDEALRLYNALPEDMKKFKTVMLYRIAATPVEDEAAYLKAVEEYVAEYPEDASVGLISMDVAVMRKDPEMLVTAHHAMTSWTGGDPFLDLMIGANLANLGEIEAGEKMVEGIDVDASELLEAQDFRATISLAANDHDETLLRLRVMRDRFGLEFADLSTAEGFEEFVQSPQYQELLNDNR